LTDFKPLLI